MLPGSISRTALKDANTVFENTVENVCDQQARNERWEMFGDL
jgi:hypothetical protein